MAARPHPEMITQVLEAAPDIVVISSLQPYGLIHARKLAAELESRTGKLTIVVGLWNYQGPVERVWARFGVDSKEQIVTTLGEAVQRVRALTGSEPLVSQQSNTLATTT